MKRVVLLFSKLSFFREWRLATDRMSQFYRHELNLYQWRFHPERPGDKVLDLCSGDGSCVSKPRGGSFYFTASDPS